MCIHFCINVVTTLFKTRLNKVMGSSMKDLKELKLKVRHLWIRRNSDILEHKMVFKIFILGNMCMISFQRNSFYENYHMSFHKPYSFWYESCWCDNIFLDSHFSSAEKILHIDKKTCDFIGLDLLQVIYGKVPAQD